MEGLVRQVCRVLEPHLGNKIIITPPDEEDPRWRIFDRRVEATVQRSMSGFEFQVASRETHEVMKMGTEAQLTAALAAAARHVLRDLLGDALKKDRQANGHWQAPN